MMEPLSILLVDDNPTFLRIMTRFLRGQKRLDLVGTALGGQEALEKAQKLHPHVILLDLVMPDIGGLQVIPRIRELLPQTQIVALTFMDAGGYREAALAAGADAFVSKSSISTKLMPVILHENGTTQSSSPNIH